MSMTLDEIVEHVTSKVPRQKGLPPTCHPDRRHASRGLCFSCYGIWRRSHPHVWASVQAANKRWDEKNKKRRRDYQKKWWATDNNARRAALRQKYGITLDDFNLMGARQEGRCGICSDPLVKPHVDHDHRTGQVRALLCFRCNNGLGSFNDSPAKMRKAAEYLEHWKGVHQS